MVEFNPLKMDIDPVFDSSTNKKESSETILRPTTDETNTSTIIHNSKPAIRTYKDDIQSAIQANHLSSINIAVAENEKMHSQISGEETVVKKSKSKLIIITVLILMIIGGGGFFSFTYLSKNDTKIETVNVQIPNSLITTEYKDELNTNTVVKDRFTSALSSRLNDIQIPTDNIYNIYITTGSSTNKKLINSQEFISLAGLQMPDMIKRNLINEFMIGMYSLGQNLPFVIFKTSSFENTYAGMIEWEKNLEIDFRLLFRLGSNNGLQTLDKALTPTVAKKFIDSVVVNKDVRILVDEQGKPMLVYGIVDKNTIILTVNEDAFREIVNRLNREKGLKR